MEYDTGRSRGTGFACFWNREHADAVITESEKLRLDTLGALPNAPHEKKKNPFAMHSVLTPDPSASSAQSLVLLGRTLDVVRAVTRDEASKLREDGEKRREKADKRNIYLLREGGGASFFCSREMEILTWLSSHLPQFTGCFGDISH